MTNEIDKLNADLDLFLAKPFLDLPTAHNTIAMTLGQHGLILPALNLKGDDEFLFELKDGANDLVQWCRKYAVTHPGTGLFFLTALPHDYSMPYAAQDKAWWADRHFPGIPVFLGPFSHDKWRHCKAGDILIDDRHSNCSEWRSAGGMAHEYRTWEQCKVWLEDTLKWQLEPAQFKLELT